MRGVFAVSDDLPPQRLVVLGAGGYAREVLEIVDALNARRRCLQVVGVVAATGDQTSQQLDARGVRVLGDDSVLDEIDASYVIAIGSADIRRRLDKVASAHGLNAATLVHPAATVGASVQLGPGSVVAAGARLTDNITLGRHTHVNLNATIGHDCVLGDYVTVGPLAAVSGACVIEDRVTVGTGAVVIQQRRVGAGSTVGAGSALLCDIGPDLTAIGNPARALRW